MVGCIRPLMPGSGWYSPQDSRGVSMGRTQCARAAVSSISDPRYTTVPALPICAAAPLLLYAGFVSCTKRTSCGPSEEKKRSSSWSRALSLKAWGREKSTVVPTAPAA